MEFLFLEEIGSTKIGYASDRHYQIQIGMQQFGYDILRDVDLDWGKYADAVIVSVMLLFFIFSAVNHGLSAVRDRKYKMVNLMRSFMYLLLVDVLLPPMISALTA